MTLRGFRPQHPAGVPPLTPQDAVDRMVRDSFAMFVRKVFSTLHPDETFKTAWYVDAMCAVGQAIADGKQSRHIVNVPPRSGKSTIFSVALPAYLIGHNPSLSVLCVSYIEKLALDFSRDTLKVMESDWYKRAFPNVRIRRSTEDKLETDANGFRQATSIGGVGLGLGADLIVIDDPLKAEDARSEAARERVDRFYRDTLSTRFFDPKEGVILIVMQRLHEDDLCGRVLAREAWPALLLPAISDVDDEVELGQGRRHKRCVGDLLDAERLPMEELDKKRKLMGSDVFSAQYLQAPAPSEGLIIKTQWIHYYQAPPPRSTLRVVQSWDTAIKGDPSNDFSVCTTWGELNQIHYLLDVYRKRLNFVELIRAAEDLYGRYQPNAVLVEAQGSGVQLSRMLKDRHNIHTIERKPTRDKESRLADVSPVFEANQVILPENAPWLQEYIKELLMFPKTRHDDQVDSTSQYLAWAVSRSTDFTCYWT